jgi:hypothetical protein
LSGGDDFKAIAVVQIGELDLDTVIWRYLTFKKFIPLIKFNALWFAKLGIFEDAEEGVAKAMHYPRTGSTRGPACLYRPKRSRALTNRRVGYFACAAGSASFRIGNPGVA